MVFKNICVLFLWTKVALALERLKDNHTMNKTKAQIVYYLSSKVAAIGIWVPDSPRKAFFRLNGHSQYLRFLCVRMCLNSNILLV